MTRTLPLVGLVAVVLLAGCAGSMSPQATDSATRTTSTQSAVNSAPSPSVTQIAVPPCPDRPDSFSRETVSDFAMQFEQARETRLARASTSKNLTELRVRTEDANVTRTGDGWIVQISVYGPYMQWNTSDPDAANHIDPAFYTASYFITNDTVRRAQAAKLVDPRETGITVACPPGIP